MRRFPATSYGRILDDYLLIRWNGGAEDELGYLSAMTRGVLRYAPDGALRRSRMRAMAEEWQRYLGLTGEETSVPSPREPALKDVVSERLRSRTAPRALLHEGYSVDPDREGAPGVVELARARDAAEGPFLATEPAVWSGWAAKDRFRIRCREIFGEPAVAPGVELAPSGVDVVERATRAVLREYSGTAIVKAPGVCGAGNIVVTHGSDLYDRLAHAAWSWEETAVCIEAWLDWEATYGVSFFLPETGPVQPLAVARQQVDERLGRFIGSTSELELSEAELARTLELLFPLFEAMRADGVRGVAAVDCIVAGPNAWGTAGLPLPGGRRLCLIECNPRMTRHTRVGLVVERVARQWGVAAEDISWQLSDSEPPRGRSAAALARRTESSCAETGLPVTAGGDPRRPHFLVALDKAERVTTLSLQLSPATT
jgi:hypothetical protein